MYTMVLMSTDRDIEPVAKNYAIYKHQWWNWLLKVLLIWSKAGHNGIKCWITDQIILDVINDTAGYKKILKNTQIKIYWTSMLRLLQKLKGVNWEDEIKLGVVQIWKALPFKYRYTTMRWSQQFS